MVCFTRKVVKAAEEQMNRLWHTTSIYLNPALQEYAAKLASKMPGDLKVSKKVRTREN